MSKFIPSIPIVLSIAGSDNTAGAGIQADIKACMACGVYTATVITAVTAQNSSGVKAIEYVGSEMLQSQLEATLEFAIPDAVKIGLIPNSDAARIVRDVIDRYCLKNIVIDPVLSATCGGNFGGGNEETVSAISSLLFDKATIVTPNLPELFKLCGREPFSCDIEEAAIDLIDKYSVNALLVKGGHSEENECTDILIRRDLPTISFNHSRIDSIHTHGTGCTFSSAIASALAKGNTLEESIRAGKETVTRAIQRGRDYPVTEKYGPVQP